MNDKSQQEALRLPRSLHASSRVYVLRVWHEGTTEPLSWRALVREGPQGERQYFASVDDCLEHLYTELLRK